jgi:drug/metabolite transporter (DMT)-like permease
MHTPGLAEQPRRFLVILAFAAVYVIWGSTYLAIRVTVESIPPFFSAGVRFLVAGMLLFAFMKARGASLPTRAQWRHSLVTGLFLLLGGNGLVVWAEQSLSSGRAALLVALAPVWFATLEWLRPAGKRPETRTIVGIVIGLVGVLLLVGGRGGADNSSSLIGSLAVVVAGISWAAGSLYNKHSRNDGSVWMNAASQMICGGVALLVLSLAVGETAAVDWSVSSTRSLWALLYLIVFGSWIGFSAYVWLLKVSTPGKVSTYAYINPVIALFLGWAILDEVITRRMLWGALVILAGVIIITLPAAVSRWLTKERRSVARASLVSRSA